MRIALLLLCLLASGCGSPLARYGRDRALDLADVVPISFAAGPGLLVEARVTRFIGLGAGYADVWRAGLDDARFGLLWHEVDQAVPILSQHRFAFVPEDGPRWAGGGTFASPVENPRRRANTWIFHPGLPVTGCPVPAPPGLSGVAWEVPPISPWQALDVEFGVVLGLVGVRIAASPLQCLDFIAGLATFDPAADDADPPAPPAIDPLEQRDENARSGSGNG